MTWKVPLDSRSDRVFQPPLKGTVEQHRFRSDVLEGNPLGDPTERDLPVYIPPSGRTEGLPLLLLLSGYTGAGWMHFQRRNFLHVSIVARLDRLIRSGATHEAVLVAPDCLTTLGGSQYLNSSGTGRYEDYLLKEVLPWIRERYRTGPVALLGTSSGGYGSIVQALRHPGEISAAASNAGDMYFEYCYVGDFPVAAREIRKAGGPDRLLEKIFSEPISGYGPRNPSLVALETIGYASCYSPSETEPGGIELPFDWVTGAMRPSIWERWLAWDPVRMIQRPEYQSALERLEYVYLDGGLRDEYYLDLGARIFTDTAEKFGRRVDFAEFDGVHSDGGPRYDVMIPRLLNALGFRPPESG